MGFAMRVVRNSPLTGEMNLDQALRTFLEQIGYFPEGHKDDTGFTLVRNCFLAHPEKAWTVDELLTEAGSSTSTLYRYLNKLKGLDILDEVVIPMENIDAPSGKKNRKGYRIRFSSLSLAWSLVESHTKVAMENYRKSVDHIDLLSRKERDEEMGAFKNPSLTVDGIILRVEKGKKKILLVKRKNEPFKGMWALPGGFVEYGETTEKAVIREIKEETGLDVEILDQVMVASSPDRDPRGHTISIVYLVRTISDDDPVGGDDAEEVGWKNIDSLPTLAFDHERILKKYQDIRD